MSEAEKPIAIVEPNILAFVLPFVVNMLIVMRFSPELDPSSIDDHSVRSYSYLVIAQVIFALGICLFFARTIFREFPFRVDFWSVIVGVVGFVLWIGICWLGIERAFFGMVGLDSWFPERAGFNPFTQITDGGQRTLFLVFRFTLLALMIPVIEELLLRGWFVRFIESEQWTTVKLSEVGQRGVIAVAIYAVATHPGEAIAAIVWFTLVTWMMIKTGKFWNCVVAHAITNLLLGIYVCFYEQWHLW